MDSDSVISLLSSGAIQIVDGVIHQRYIFRTGEPERCSLLCLLFTGAGLDKLKEPPCDRWCKTLGSPEFPKASSPLLLCFSCPWFSPSLFLRLYVVCSPILTFGTSHLPEQVPVEGTSFFASFMARPYPCSCLWEGKNWFVAYQRKMAETSRANEVET